MLEQKVQIEFARLSDADEISRLSRDEVEYGLRWNYTAARITGIIRNKSKNAIVARLDGDLVGFGIMTYHQDQANLDLLAIKKEYRRNKVATELMLWLEKVALTAGVYNVFVQLRKTNRGAFKLYQSLGYQTLEKLPKYYGRIEDGILMVKSFRPMINTE